MPCTGEDELFAEDYLWERIGSDKSRTDVQPRNKWVGAGTAPAHGQVWNMIARAIRETHSELEVRCPLGVYQISRNYASFWIWNIPLDGTFASCFRC